MQDNTLNQTINTLFTPSTVHSERGNGPRPLPGLTREAEEASLSEIIEIAQKNLENARQDIRRMGEDVEALFESAEQEDKSTLILWNDTKIRLEDLRRGVSRFEKARKKPYFGRIDFQDPAVKYEESYYVGRLGIARGTDDPLVIDWRAPIASAYYESKLGSCRYTVSSEGTFEIDLKRKRTYEIENDHLKDFYDSDVVANDELLTRYLARNKKAVLNEIIATIQDEQNRIIRRSPKTNIIVQGCAGSGKTTVAMHRISYILYNYAEEFRPEDFYIIGSNQILLNYITGVLPDLDVYGVSQMTMEQLFIRLLYEDWDPAIYSVRSADKTDPESCLKGSTEWFKDLEAFCNEYEKQEIPEQEIRLEKTGALLAGANLIRTYLRDNPLMSMQSKKLMLNEILVSKFENEVQGKNISFTSRERKELQKAYETWFGGKDWKGSIFDLYRSFLEHQAAAGKGVRIPDHAYDLYDLAALAYIYKRIKETDPIREASHVVIDEAQDFGMMAYYALHYCLRNCTYTIMGDTSQNIHFGSGLNDWEELRGLILTGSYDAFGLLKKSYRNTVEISDYAMNILRHGSFPVYPVEPILRHGSSVRTDGYRDVRSLFTAVRETIASWQEKGYETIAVVCSDEHETQKVAAELQKTLPVIDGTQPDAEFGTGIMVLPVDYTKGLEFDAVLLFNPSDKSYPQEDGYVKLLYVAATRALHELAVLYRGHLTPLIAEPVPEGKHLQELSAGTLTKAIEYDKKTYTQKELLAQERSQGAKEMNERSYYGPERIVIPPAAPAPAVSLSVSGKTSASAGTAITGKSGPTGTAAITGKSGPAGITAISGKSRPAGTATDSGTIAASASGQKNPSRYKFGDMVSDSTALRPKGHARINNAIRWVKKTRSWVDLASSYGILRLTPLTPEIIRVSFVKGSLGDIKPACWDLPQQAGIKFTCRESGKLFELTTGSITIRIEKANGAIRFMKPDGTLLLSEKAAEPRQLESGQVWMYFDWQKSEKLKAKGILPTDLMDLSKKARYISHGGRSMRMPLLLSDRNYALAFPAPSTVLCCAIPMYGPYVYTGDTDQLDYCFIYGGGNGKNIELYTQISQVLSSDVK